MVNDSDCQVKPWKRAEGEAEIHRHPKNSSGAVRRRFRLRVERF